LNSPVDYGYLYVILVRIKIGLKRGLTCDYRVFFFLQPREIKEIKDFLLKARRKDAKCKYNYIVYGFIFVYN
jgi:Ribosomal L38e protein family.